MKWKSIPITLIVIQAALITILLGQSRKRDLGPFVWDDEILTELRAVRAEHKVMQSQIVTNTQHLTDLDRRVESHENNQIGDKLVERIAALEAGYKLVIGIGLATLGVMVSFIVWMVKNIGHIKRNISTSGEGI